MVIGFCKSAEGAKEYQKIGIPYPDSFDDEQYAEWLKKTSVEDLSKYTHHKEKEVSQITVHQIGKDQDDKKNTFITYSYTHWRLDPACNAVAYFRSGIGKYPIPRPHYVVKNLDFGKQVREVDRVESAETGYSIKYTKANLQKIADMGLQSEGKVSYTVSLSNGIRVSVATFNDLLNGSFDELAHFGKIPTEHQRRLWLEQEGRTEADKQRLAKAARMKDERDIPEPQVTASQVKQMIRQEQTQQT